MTITRRGKALAGASLYLSSSSLPFRRLLLRSFVPFSNGELARHLFRESLTLSSKRTMLNREVAIDASYDEREWRKVKFAIEVTKNQMKREPRRSAKFRSKKSMKCKSFPLRSPRSPSSNSDRPRGVLLLSFFVDHPIDPLVPRSYLLRRFAYTRDSTKRGPRVTGPRSKGGLPRVSPHDGQFVCRKDEAPGREKFEPAPFLALLPTSPSLSLRAVTYLTRPRDGSTLRRECASASSPPPSSFLSPLLLLAPCVRGSNRSTVLLLPTSNLCAKTKNSFSLPSLSLFLSFLGTSFRATNRITRRGNWLISRRGRLPAR